MPDPNLQAVASALLPDATRRLIRTTDALADDDYAAPSSLPGWSRAHVVAHLALNAEGLAAALGGILESRRAPMYDSQERRDADIDELSGRTPSVLRSRMLGACTDLAEAFTAVPHDQWGTTIDRVPGGTSFTVGAVPVMRLREVEIHHVDLDAGYTRASWPVEFAELLVDTMGQRGATSEPFLARATDVDRSWSFADGGPVVEGTAADLAWWLTGRGDGSDLTSDSGALPQIGAW